MIHNYVSEGQNSASWSVGWSGRIPGGQAAVLVQAFDGYREMSRNAMTVEQARILGGLLRPGSGADRADSGGENPGIVFDLLGPVARLTVRDSCDRRLACVEMDASHLPHIADALEDAASRAQAAQDAV